MAEMLFKYDDQTGTFQVREPYGWVEVAPQEIEALATRPAKIESGWTALLVVVAGIAAMALVFVR